MLTNSDLSKIKKVVKEVAMTKDDAKNFATKGDLKNFASKDDLKNLVTKDDAKNLATKGDLKPLKQDISKIRSSINDIIGFFDNEYINLRRRVERIEEHLGISPVN